MQGDRNLSVEFNVQNNWYLFKLCYYIAKNIYVYTDQLNKIYLNK